MNPADAQRSAPVDIPDRAPAPRFTGRGQIDAWEREVPRPGPAGTSITTRPGSSGTRPRPRARPTSTRWSRD